jgi:hypothetical protein
MSRACPNVTYVTDVMGVIRGIPSSRTGQPQTP